jgi:hypothetical protein
MPGKKVAAHFGEERKASIKIIVGQKEIGPPKFEPSENQGGNE